jgi:hypothetical protein
MSVREEDGEDAEDRWVRLPPSERMWPEMREADRWEKDEAEREAMKQLQQSISR